jgi:hypothetical protein
MDWEAVGAVGEVLGALGVIVTLGYLATQVRQNTKALRTESYRAWGDQINRINLLPIDNPEFAELNGRAYLDPESLTDAEWQKVSVVMLSTMHLFEALFVGASEGTIDRKLWQAEQNSLKHWLAEPVVARWWALNPYGFTDEFRAMVDDLLAVPIEKGAIRDAYLVSPFGKT